MPVVVKYYQIFETYLHHIHTPYTNTPELKPIIMVIQSMDLDLQILIVKNITTIDLHMVQIM